jgi:hypothetical protein
MTELREIVDRAHGSLDVTVLFARPEGVEEGWEKTDLWREALTLPGALVLVDERGLEAKRFGAETSGHVVVYDGSGKLVFSGGITGSRGHAGENVGEGCVVSVARGERAGHDSTPVYGCPLEGKCEPPREDPR